MATSSTFTLTGHIFDEFNTPISNATVQAYDKDLSDEQLLGVAALTDSSGFYNITFDALQATAAELKTPDAFIRVSDRTGNPLGQSAISFNISSPAVIDFKTGNTKIKSLNEFDMLMQLLQPLVVAAKLEFKNLTEKEQHISFLAGETGADQIHIELLVKAFQLVDEANKSLTPLGLRPTYAADLGIFLPAVFYSLLRQGFPVSLNELLQINAESIKKAIQQAMDENIISIKFEKRLNEIIKIFNDLSVEKIVVGDDGQPAVLKQLFGSLLSADQQKTFAATYFEHEEQPEKFWDQLKLQPGFTDNAAIEKTKNLLNLNLLIDQQPELAKHLFIKQSSDPDLKEMRGFAKFNKTDWKQQIAAAGIPVFPEWVKGDTAEEKTDHYAASLEQLHKKLYPTTFFASRMKEDIQSSFLIKEELNVFFKTNPGFDLNTKSIHKQFEASSFENMQDKEAVKKELKTLNRLYKLTDDYKQVNDLYSKQLFSSADIIKNYGRERFVTQFAGVTGGAGKAAQLYKKAVSVNNRTTALITGYKTRHDIKVYAIDGNNAEPEGYHEMFGDGELCECEHCQSVYSPSAYFVDMLAFIKSENEMAYNELLHRRPDLEHILLTCKNTNTPLPYIDLVNELLEKEVVKLSGIVDTEGITAITHSYQTEGIAAEIVAIPEHTSINAYEPLKTVAGDAVFSAVLPIDLPLEEIRTYSEKLGWRRYEMMDKFYGSNDPGKMKDATLAAELFWFSDAELNIINGGNPFTVTLPVDLKGKCIINLFLEKTKLSYIELLQLLETYFLNLPVEDGIRPIQINQIGAVPGVVQLLTCNLDKLELIGASNEWLNKAIRFTRFMKKIGWDIFDLDRALTVLGISDFRESETGFNEQILIPFAHIEKIKYLLNIPVRQVITFFGNIDTVTYIEHHKEGQPPVLSLYDELFRNALVNDASIVCAAFRISAAEYTLLQTTEDFSMTNLSQIYRKVLLARSLNISISDLKELISFTGNQTNSLVWTPEKLYEFLEQWEIFKSTGIKAVEFKGCFNAVSDTEYMIPVDYKLIKAVTDCMRELIAINNNAAQTADESKAQSTAKITGFLEALSINTVLVEALAMPVSKPADMALKTVFENYMGEGNKEVLQSLPANEIILKLEALRKSLLDYINVVLKKAPTILERLKFNPEEILWINDNIIELEIDLIWNETIDFENEGFFKAFSKLYYLSVLAKIRSASSFSWIDLLEIAVINGENAKASWFQAFINLYSVAETSLEFICGSKDEVTNKGRANFNFREDYIIAKNLLEILSCCRIVEKLGGNKEQLNALLRTTALPTDIGPVKNLLKSKYGNKEWLDIIKPINDRLRTRRRDALVAWLLANTNGGAWYSTNAIYECLLIDTEMDACMVTSRIKQGISSIQLFIDRCLMNLETTPNMETIDDPDDTKKIILGAEFAEQWHTWRKQYRVWEANRKIFLYPENWIEPDLRDDKSPFFEELESQLKQNEVTEETAKEALITYLNKLDTVANLEMVGLFHDEEPKIVHVFGRTQNIPHQYFYRKQENSVWSAWEKVEMDIDGDHILPVVWNGRLMLFWPKFTEKQVEGSSSTSLKGRADDMTMTTLPPEIYLDVKLVWSEYKNKKWSSKKMTKEAISLNPSNNFTPKEYQISLQSEIENGELFIKLFAPLNTDDDAAPIYEFIRYTFDGCNNKPKCNFIGLDTGVSTSLLKLGKVIFEKVFVKENPEQDWFSLVNSGFLKSAFDAGSMNETILLKNTPGDFQIVFNNYKPTSLGPVTFFYSNSKNNFYVNSHEYFSPDLPENTLINNTAPSIGRKMAKPLLSKKVKVASIPHASPPLAEALIPVLTTNLPVFEIDLYRNYKGKKYLFQTFYHPSVCSYIKLLNAIGIVALYQQEIQNKIPESIFTTTKYNPTPLVLEPFPIEEVDFSFTGSYSIFNWELFYHIPLLIATRLTQNQKFEEARKWFHYIFDPTSSSDTETGAERFWITKPFKKEIEEGLMTLEDLLNRPENADELDVQLSNWEKNPFNPHAVARLRISAYMRNTVLRYIDNLIQWGDQLFRKDTIESINEATLLYVLASNILGKRMDTVPPRAKQVEQSFSDIKGKIDRFRNVKAEIESFISPSSAEDDILMPYFCLPKNDYLFRYWDTVADRLFKIRHCMNVEGVVRQLPLFEPPLDPALLMRAKDAGLDLNTILDDVNIGLPNYRFQVMLQQANELCNDVKTLGASLLSALEKKDGEELSLLRSTHELNMLEIIRDVKEKQRDEANENLNSLQASRAVIEERFSYYSNNASTYLNTSEKLYFDLTNQAIGIQHILELKNFLASGAALIPDLKLGSGFTIGATFGGTNLANAETAASHALQSIASLKRLEAESANMKGGYDRRMGEWKFQSKTADLEIRQIDKQILAAEIRLAIAEKELENHDRQMEQSKEVDDYMRSKFTNSELYDWMVGQLSTVYFQSYQLAYTTAKKAEKCLQHELGLEGTNYVQFGYWDSLKKGLLSGERLQYDLRRLENGYLEENKREYEITKHISTALLNPLALLQLKEKGKCDINLPEELFDLDFPGHYFRRIKSVSISIPCIAGPYSSVNATLRLRGNEYRIDKSATDAGLYKKTSEEISAPDTGRFRSFNSFSAIATSSAQNDSGVFELNFRDERYLPFEGAGVISSWSLELPNPKLAQFDYNTMSDVIMHIKYTSREGGEGLKNAASEGLLLQINEMIVSSEDRGLMRLFSLKNDFPDEFYKMKTDPTTGEVSKGLKIGKTFFPYFANNYQISFKNCSFYAKDGAVILPEQIKSNNAVTETIDDDWSLSLNYNSTYFKEQGDIYMLINYSLANL